MAIRRDDPYTSFHFVVELGGFGDGAQGGFSEVSGLAVKVPGIDYRNGNEPGGMRKLPGIPGYGNITLKRGVIGDTALWDWVQQAQQGRVERIDGVISLLNDEREPAMRWRFRRGWATRYSGPRFDAQANAVAIESVEIAHEGLSVD